MFATKAKLSSNKEYNNSYTFTHNVYVHVLYKVGLDSFSLEAIKIAKYVLNSLIYSSFL